MINIIDFLNKLSPCFSEIKNICDKDICFDLLKNSYTVIPENDFFKNKMIKGFMQSKKTWTIISIAIYYYLHGIKTIILIENKLSSLKQLIFRFNMIISEITNNIENINLQTCRSKNISKETLESKDIILCLRSVVDIKHLLKNNVKDFVLLLDESDAVDNMSNCSVSDEIRSIKQIASVVWNISATSITSLMNDEILTENTILLRPPDFYKDLKTFNMIKLDETKENKKSLIDWRLKKYLSDFYLKNMPSKTYSIPNITLIKISNKIKIHIKLSKYIYKNYGDKIICITFNGSSSGITLRGTIFKCLGKSIEKYLIDKLGKEIRVSKNKTVLKISNCSICDILDFLKHLKKDITHICIISGKMADRGISFCSSQKDNSEPWHLTEMYYIPSKATDQGNLLQCAGRLCGVFKDDIPLTLYSDCCDDIIKAYNIQEELLQRAKKNEGIMKNIIPEIPISKNKCQKRRITAKNVECKLNKVKNDQDSGGWDWNQDKKENLEKENLEIISQLYGDSSSMIHKIITIFIENKFQPLTKEDIRNYTGNHKLNLTNYDRWGTHWKYHVLEKINSKQYILRNKIKDFLKL